MKDIGSLIEQDEHQARLGRAYDMADQLDTVRAMRRQSELPSLEAMEQFGGSFVKAIAHAARVADQTNYERLRSAFEHLWKRYREEHVRRVDNVYDESTEATTDQGSTRL